MPNPFPGMDPYLEGDPWTSVHTDLCAEMARQLAPKLRPKYVTRSTRQVVIASAEENGHEQERRFPEVGILTSAAPPASGLVAARGAPLLLDAKLPELVPHVSIEIYDVAWRRLVTCIELLSPSNKSGSGVEDYARKRLQVITAGAHLVEIDLLRAGTRFPTTEPLPTSPYFVFVSDAARPKKVEMALERPLISFPVPLLLDDDPVRLDLQQALQGVYEIFAYDESIDYSQPPPGPLTPDQASWMDETLRRAGRRT